MFVERKIYGIKCDNCGTIQQLGIDGNSYSGGYYDLYKDGALAAADCAHWHTDGQVHFCENCSKELEWEERKGLP